MNSSALKIVCVPVGLNPEVQPGRCCDRAVGLLEQKDPGTVVCGRDVTCTNDVLIPGRAVDDLEVVLIAGDGRDIIAAVLEAIAGAAAGPSPVVLARGDRIRSAPPQRRNASTRHERALVVHVKVPQLRRTVEGCLVDAAAVFGPAAHPRRAAQNGPLVGIRFVMDAVPGHSRDRPLQATTSIKGWRAGTPRDARAERVVRRPCVDHERAADRCALRWR